MTTYLLIADALSSPEMRHEIGEAVMDPMIFIDHDDKRILVGSLLEEPIFSTREDVIDEFLSQQSLGYEELITNEKFPVEMIQAELAARVLRRVGTRTVIVPPTFPLAEADYLRSTGIDLVIDADAWADRRRRKAPWELEGIERAQRAVETAMLTAARMLREAEPTANGQLRFEGEILTSEWIRESMSAELLMQGAESEEIIVQSGDACLRGHEPGSGPILPDQSCIIDCFPRDRRTGVYTDMTRTFVPGTPSEELKKLHKTCCEALEIAFAAIKPGAEDAHAKVAEHFHRNGFPTKEHHTGTEPLTEGFWHGLGHGVGLQVHERPRMGRRPEPFVEGDVVAVEPGLYFSGIGGVRLEDTVLVTEEGVEHITDPLSYELTP